LNLKKVVAVEIALLLAALVAGMYIIIINPYLESSKQDLPLRLFNEQSFPEQTTTLERGQIIYGDFNYSGYKPPILLIDMTFQDCKTNGYITVYLNERFVARIYVTPENKRISSTAVSCAGIDWVRPREATAVYFLSEPEDGYNVVYFLSEPEDGYEGTFSYRFRLRGSQ